MAVREIVTILCGSHLYGCDLDTSDRDYKVVYIPSAPSILLQHGDRLEEGDILAAVTRIKKLMRQAGLSISKSPDVEFLSVRQYMKLVCQGQTNAMDMLFAPREFYLGKPEAEWLVIQGLAPRWISKNSASFVGYCRDQVKKYSVKQDRFQSVEAIVNYLHAVDDRTMRLNELPDLHAYVAGNPHSEMVMKETAHGAQLDHLSVCQTMIPVTATVKVALETYERKLKEYGERVRANEQMGDKDWKSLYHAVRVAYEAIELMETGKIILPRPERSLLKAIRLGKIPFDRVQAMVEENLSLVEQAVAKSALPEQPDWAHADRLVATFHRGAVLTDHEPW
jgi:hypothetical protein